MNILRLFETAANDRSRGASEIERDLLLKLPDFLWRKTTKISELRQGARILSEGQPCMANLLKIAEMLHGAKDLEELAVLLEKRLEILLRLGTLLATHSVDYILTCRTVLTISRSSAVLAALSGAVARGWMGRVCVLDGTPSGRGPEQAERIRKLDLEVFSLPDGATLEAFDEASASLLVLAGADAVGPRRLINAQGTQVLAELAGARSVRRIVIADSGKDVPEDTIDRILWASPRMQESPDRSWPIFEACPLELFDLRICEDGPLQIPGSSRPTTG